MWYMHELYEAQIETGIVQSFTFYLSMYKYM